ncbi:MAG: DNA mismatch endonuclease Vsr [Desulfuromonadales bacterium]|nr:DNA mismatch endonuclease Vsr [Desulfuromonadales bacterium]
MEQHKTAKIKTPPSEQKSRMMSQVRTKGTSPELALRSALHSDGIRFRLHRKDLPGKPDIVLPKYKFVIFVHGCFWHHHEGCIKSNMPKTNIDFWQNKIAANVRRDKTNQGDLTKLGWQTLVVWECDIKKDVCGVVKRVIDELHVNCAEKLNPSPCP